METFHINKILNKNVMFDIPNCLLNLATALLSDFIKTHAVPVMDLR